MINKSEKKQQTIEKFIKQSCFVQDDENGYMYLLHAGPLNNLMQFRNKDARH